jgi:hypothetical protein
MRRPLESRGEAEARRPGSGFRVAATPRFVAPMLCWVSLVAAGCGVLSPEEQLLMRFFEASRLHDTTMVATLSTVTFNPRTEGVVEDFDVEDVQDEGDAKRVTVRASVRQLSGSRSDRTLVIRMVRKGDRWFITAIVVAT